MEVAVAEEKQGIADAEGSAAEAAAAPGERPVGQLLVEARTRRGLSAEDVTAQTRIPPLYLKAIETDNYGLISDQLYLLPFLRRYAAFVGLDPEDIASRFIHDVQRAETNVVRMSEPITMVSRKRHPLRRFAIGVVLAAGAAILILLALSKLGMLRRVAIPGFGASSAAPPIAASQASPAAAPAASNAPLATSIKPAAPPGAGNSGPRQAGAYQQVPAGAPD
jgi:cytoskeleton protein RodZ